MSGAEFDFQLSHHSAILAESNSQPSATQDEVDSATLVSADTCFFNAQGVQEVQPNNALKLGTPISHHVDKPDWS